MAVLVSQPVTWNRIRGHESRLSMQQLILQNQRLFTAAIIEDSDFPNLQRFHYEGGGNSQDYATAYGVVNALRRTTGSLRHLYINAITRVVSEDGTEISSLRMFTHLQTLTIRRYDLILTPEEEEEASDDDGPDPDAIGSKAPPFVYKLPDSLLELRIGEADATTRQELQDFAVSNDRLPNLRSIILIRTLTWEQQQAYSLETLRPTFYRAGR
ncbi:hypothetical protein PMZ80_007527 [Knufia obscura]|uniref:Uncharacterized protein n=1 Tax=Knufia obscura TaxID=1635080 RepID=A0ABR0RHL5_9EURO|nr:hypothetical protein PMZ80_007527 [Knufia obscura]